MTIRRASTAALASAAAFATGLTLIVILGLGTGCDSGTEEVRRVLPVLGLAFNDSVGPSDTLYLKVQVQYASSCEKNAGFEVQQLNDTTYTVVPVAVYQDDEVCTGEFGVTTVLLRVLQLGGDRLRRFLVAGENTLLQADVRSGAAPTATGIRFRVRVEDRDTKATVANAPVEIRDVTDNQILASGTTDANGVFAYDRPCVPPNDAPLEYVVHASANSRAATLVFRTPPARCGLAEVIVIRV